MDVREKLVELLDIIIQPGQRTLGDIADYLNVYSDGTLGNGFAYEYGSYGVRPLCVLKSEILKSYLFGERDVVRAPKHYFNTYNCKCGQCITVKYRRAGATW